MAKDRIVLRNDRGAGVVFKTRKEADAFLKVNDGYQVEGDETEAETKAVTADETEDKSVKPAANKSRG